MSFRLFCLLSCIALFSCAATNQESLMDLCNNRNYEKVDTKILKKALIKAQRWASSVYGKSCVTCAEIYSVESETFTLHITSPGDLLINTSATMEFDNRTAKIINKSIYHSCHVYYKN